MLSVKKLQKKIAKEKFQKKLEKKNCKKNCKKKIEKCGFRQKFDFHKKKQSEVKT